MTIGQIGLGNMGMNLAKHLLDKDYDVVGFDVSDEAVNEFAEYGGRAANSNADVAEQSDIILTALPNSSIVRDVYLGPGGIVEGGSEGLVCLEQSTIPPGPAQDIAEEIREEGIEMLDVPFGGRPKDCRDGSLISTVGGDRNIYDDELIQDLLETISTEAHYMGSFGAGKTTKIVNNMMALGNTALAMEAMAVGVAHDVDPANLYEALKNHGGTSKQFRGNLPRVLNRNFESRFPVSYAQKDLGYALQMGEEVDFPMSITSNIYHEYTTAAATGRADEDSSAIVKLYEDYIDDQVKSDVNVETE